MVETEVEITEQLRAIKQVNQYQRCRSRGKLKLFLYTQYIDPLKMRRIFTTLDVTVVRYIASQFNKNPFLQPLILVIVIYNFTSKY